MNVKLFICLTAAHLISKVFTVFGLSLLLFIISADTRTSGNLLLSMASHEHVTTVCSLVVNDFQPPPSPTSLNDESDSVGPRALLIYSHREDVSNSESFKIGRRTMKRP